MKGIAILECEMIATNEAGATYATNIHHNDQCILGYRKAGSISGRHYHEGISKQKDPEVLILITGEAELFAKDIRTGETYRKQLQAPLRIEISPYIWHEIKAVTDISFIELNSLKEHKADTQYISPD